MQMLGGFLILLGCFGMGLWYRQQFLGRLYTIRELIRILEQWISEIRYNGSTLPECCRQTGRQRKDRLGEICTEVYREYAETEDAGFLELAEKSFRRQLRMLPLKKEDIEEFLRFAEPVGCYRSKKNVYNIKNGDLNVDAYPKYRNFVSTNHQ